MFRTDEAILVIRQFDVYPTGIEFTVDLRVRPTNEQMFDMPWELHSSRRRCPMAADALPDEFLRLGFSFPDGTTWANFVHNRPALDEEPDVPVVVGRGGGGGGDGWKMRYWMWPLPPAGDVMVYAAWPMFDIEEVSAVIDGESLRRVADDALQIWD